MWRYGWHRRGEIQRQRFLKIGQRQLFGLALAGDIHFKTLRDEPIALAPDTGCKLLLHCSPSFLACDQRHLNVGGKLRADRVFDLRRLLIAGMRRAHLHPDRPAERRAVEHTDAGAGGEA